MSYVSSYTTVDVMPICMLCFLDLAVTSQFDGKVAIA
jgi:hypothetical protein